MPLDLGQLDTKTTDQLEEMVEHYRQVKRGASRYDLKRCTDALRLLNIALQRRRQGLTVEPE